MGGGGIVLPVLSAMINPILLPISLAAWLGGTYAACRKLYRRSATRRAARLDTLLDDLAEIATRHIEAAPTSDEPE